MAQVKKTKTALKAQRDALDRYERFLPTLELKKQQLRMELHRAAKKIEDKRTEREDLWATLSRWIRLFADDTDSAALPRLEAVTTDEDNIAGVAIPVFREAVFAKSTIDLFATAPWIDEAIDVIEALVRLAVEERILLEAHRRLQEELRITSQRVNLFEKVKIPECRQNIRVIRIALGDEETSAVARAKIAKEKILELQTAAE
jgi:V/A-type H+-transporting ATPase subunit D